jgi:hypothetical protein
MAEIKKLKQKENLKKIREAKYNQWWEKLKQEEDSRKEREEKVKSEAKPTNST